MTSVLDHGSIALVDSIGDDQRIVDAARVSIAGENVKPVSTNAKLIDYLMKNQHMTPFESVRFQWHVKLPIFVARQWMRHRAGSFNEVSARYGEMPDEFYVPSFERLATGGQAKDNKQGSGAHLSDEVTKDAQDAISHVNTMGYVEYQNMLDAGVARELARIVLPVSLYTQFYWNVDLRNLLHFLDLRLDAHAQWEIRQYAEAMVPIVETVCPLAVAAWRTHGSVR